MIDCLCVWLIDWLGCSFDCLLSMLDCLVDRLIYGLMYRVVVDCSLKLGWLFARLFGCAIDVLID